MIRSCFRLNMFTTRKFKITTSSLLTKMDMGDLQYYLDWKVLGYAGTVEFFDGGGLFLEIERII